MTNVRYHKKYESAGFFSGVRPYIPVLKKSVPAAAVCEEGPVACRDCFRVKTRGGKKQTYNAGEGMRFEKIADEPTITGSIEDGSHISLVGACAALPFKA